MEKITRRKAMKESADVVATAAGLTYLTYFITGVPRPSPDSSIGSFKASESQANLPSLSIKEVSNSLRLRKEPQNNSRERIQNSTFTLKIDSDKNGNPMNLDIEMQELSDAGPNYLAYIGSNQTGVPVNMIGIDEFSKLNNGEVSPIFTITAIVDPLVLQEIQADMERKSTQKVMDDILFEVVHLVSLTPTTDRTGTKTMFEQDVLRVVEYMPLSQV